MNPRLITRILFPTDFSDCSARAQEYAMYLATAWDVTVDVLHVIERPVWLKDNAAGLSVVEQAQKETARRLEVVQDQMARSGIAGSVRQSVGIPSEQINLVARENGADLVVLGAQGCTKILHGLLGSTAERVIKEGPCPILAVPGLGDEEARPVTEALSSIPVRHILAPVDFSSPSLDSLEYAIQLANGLGSKVTLVHVLEPLYYDLEYGLGAIEHDVRKRDHWKKQLTEFRDLIKSLGLQAEFEISGGIPSESILSSALRVGCDLIVMGTHGRRGISRLRFGSVAEAVLRRATCPVLTVKAPKFALGHPRLVPQVVAEA
ncbi:MAG: Universal stress protein family [Nitrospira sp.]|jgi:nucleotide-binding universal stress UspA family protein|nr:MAG: Universal stress protein family [Nitrospira sp.]